MSHIPGSPVRRALPALATAAQLFLFGCFGYLIACPGGGAAGETLRGIGFLSMFWFRSAGLVLSLALGVYAVRRLRSRRSRPVWLDAVIAVLNFGFVAGGLALPALTGLLTG